MRRRTAEALVVGNWVKTRAGFYGTVVEIDGDVVTLATPLGDESLWEKSAILGAEEPPFASTAQDDEAQGAHGSSGDPRQASASDAEDEAEDDDIIADARELADALLATQPP